MKTFQIFECQSFVEWSTYCVISKYIFSRNLTIWNIFAIKFAKSNQYNHVILRIILNFLFFVDKKSCFSKVIEMNLRNKRKISILFLICCLKIFNFLNNFISRLTISNISFKFVYFVFDISIFSHHNFMIIKKTNNDSFVISTFIISLLKLKKLIFKNEAKISLIFSIENWKERKTRRKKLKKKVDEKKIFISSTSLSLSSIKSKKKYESKCNDRFLLDINIVLQIKSQLSMKKVWEFSHIQFEKFSISFSITLSSFTFSIFNVTSFIFSNFDVLLNSFMLLSIFILFCISNFYWFFVKSIMFESRLSMKYEFAKYKSCNSKK